MEKILLIDDDKKFCRSLIEHLTLVGFQVDLGLDKKAEIKMAVNWCFYEK
jgi:hypothetical protein